MKYIFIILLFFSFLKSAESTTQRNETLKTKSFTCSIIETPLSPRKDVLEKISNYNLQIKEICLISNCWRGYVGSWEIVKDSLFLNKIISPCPEKGGKNLIPKFFSKEEIKGDKVFAFWVSDTLNYIDDDGSQSSGVCLQFIIKNGILTIKKDCMEINSLFPKKLIEPIIDEKIHVISDEEKKKSDRALLITCIFFSLILVIIAKALDVI